MRDARPVQGGERLQDPAQDRPRVADVHRPGARETRAERLGVDEVVAEPVRPVVLAGLEPVGQAGMVDRRDHAVGREEALHRALVAARLAPQHLEGAPLFLAHDGVDDRLPALAELSHDDERTELAAVRDLVLAEGARVGDARVDPLARDEDDVDQRVELIAVEATLGQGAGEARLARGAPDVFRVEAEQALAHRGHLIERVEALELGAENVDRRIHGGTGQQRWSRHGSEALALLDLHTTSGNGRHFRRRERVSIADRRSGPPGAPQRLRRSSHRAGKLPRACGRVRSLWRESALRSALSLSLSRRRKGCPKSTAPTQGPPPSGRDRCSAAGAAAPREATARQERQHGRERTAQPTAAPSGATTRALRGRGTWGRASPRPKRSEGILRGAVERTVDGGTRVGGWRWEGGGRRERAPAVTVEPLPYRLKRSSMRAPIGSIFH